MERLRKGAVSADVPAGLPENCLVRLIDLEPGARGAIQVDETGFVNIYINARLSHEERVKALRHELRHYYRDDLHSEAGIREVERLAEGPLERTVDDGSSEAVGARPRNAGNGNRRLKDGSLARAVAKGLLIRAVDMAPPGCDTARPVQAGEGRGPLTGGPLVRAAADLRRVRALLVDACHIADVAQTTPALPVSALLALVEGLSVEDLGPAAFRSGCAALPFQREAGGLLYGALFYDGFGLLDNALAVFAPDARRITVDLRRRRGRLDVCAIEAEGEGRTVRIY